MIYFYNKSQKISVAILVLIALNLISPVFISKVHAVALNQSILRWNRLAASTTDVLIVVMIEVAGTANEDFVDIDVC